MNSNLKAVIEYMERERGLDREVLICAVEQALASSARKSVTMAHEVRVEIDRRNFDIKAYAVKRVVAEVSDDMEEIALADARKFKPDARIGDDLEIESTPSDLGRIAAQSARQAIAQRIRLAEKERVFDEYRDSEGELISGTVTRVDRRNVYVDLGRAEGVVPQRERISTEEYQPNEHLLFYVARVESSGSGTDIILSRSHPDFVRKLFEKEVAEINDGSVIIKGIAREAGVRSKVAVHSSEEKIDPIGACVGMRGIRVRSIIRELNGEKVDIIRWSDDIKTYVTNALAPAKLRRVTVNEASGIVNVVVDPDQYAITIGRSAINLRLSQKLTGWKLEVQKIAEETIKEPERFEDRVSRAVQALAKVNGIGHAYAELLVHNGFLTLEGILAAEPSDIAQIDGISDAQAIEIIEAAKKV